VESRLAFFQQAFDAAPVGMLVVDASGVIVEANQQLAQLFQYEPAQLIGQPVELLVAGAAPTHREHRARFFHEPARRPMGAGRDLYGRRRDGVQVPVEIGLTPLVTPTGTFVLASVADLTERKRAEDQFRLAIEAAPNGMMMIDERGTVVLVNAQIEQLFGYTRAELVGTNVDLLLPERFRAGHGATRAHFFATPKARPMGAGRELFARRKDGSEVPVEIGLSPIHTPSGLLVLAAIVDITERKQARDALQAGLREKETLLRELQHRAKNNLQLIASLLDLSQQSGPEALRECRERVHSIALVHEKLYQAGTFARLELSDYLRSLAEQVALTWARSDGAAVQLHIEAQDLWLPLDHAVPCGLLINELLTNAFKHAFPNGRPGTIDIMASREGAQVVIVVADDGVGQPEGMKARPGHIGFDLISALSRLLRATLTFDTTRGTRARLAFTSVDR
jgi:PAS domain S-box-containing protein